MVFGEKDHTWNDMIIVEPDEVSRLENIGRPQFNSFDKVESNDEEEEDTKLWDNTLLDGLDDM